MATSLTKRIRAFESLWITIFSFLQDPELYSIFWTKSFYVCVDYGGLITHLTFTSQEYFLTAQKPTDTYTLFMYGTAQ